MAISINGSTIVQVIGHPIISEMVVAFTGAVIVLLVVRLVAGAGTRRRSWT